MYYYLYYNIDQNYNDVHLQSINYEYGISEDINVVIRYLYEKKYNKPYNELSWYLEDGARQFVKDIENSYLKNTLDMFALYHDYHFIDWLKDYYYNSALNECYKEFLEDNDDWLYK